MNDWEWQALEERSSVDRLEVDGIAFVRGGRVRLRPRPGGDVLDIALAGRTAAIESIEQDYEGRFHLAVVVEDDPGQDMGMRRQPGHRFFFRPEEVDYLDNGSGDLRAPAPDFRILIAGIGNIFCGDDGFGVEVAQRMAVRQWPPQVRVIDFGIRGLDLAYALLDGYDVSVLVDACPRGAAPGTIHVIEPDLTDLGSSDLGSSSLASSGLGSSGAGGDAGGSGIEPHSMHPLNVLRLARTMEGSLKKILVIGCEPQWLGGDEGAIGLSAPVAAAVDDAIARIEALVAALIAARESAAVPPRAGDGGPEGQLRKGDASDGHTATDA
jgi:Ni,Fe-hydrogenase maturation factor